MKTKPWIDRLRRYENWMDFFELDGSVVMRLTKFAALEVCAQAASRGHIISRIEGGIWQDPYFEARLDCIWDGIDACSSRDSIEANNAAAGAFIFEVVEDVFIITTAIIRDESVEVE